ncbi:MAG: hypothetical protein CMB56_006500 [Methanobacteriota archaeon]|nr:MAG: hypothetical protein CMB56_006500 [Euryarchaeota archaeon]|tara:strand:- start:683 stop:1057 length:375 start_codon:yes stop_codon:yes gene_type:complete
MSPGILEIAKAKGDDEEDYLEIEIYKDLEFWKGVGVPIISSIPFAFLVLLMTGSENGDWVGSFFCFFFLWVLIGLSLAINAQIIKRKRYSLGSYISTILGIIMGVVLSYYLVGIILSNLDLRMI